MSRLGTISQKALRKYLASTSNGGANTTFDAPVGKRQPRQSIGYGAGHINDPVNQRSLGAILANPQGDFGPADAASRQHIDRRANKRRDNESKIGNERTRVDEPRRASTARVKRTSAHEYYAESWYGHPGSRQGG
jgi:hypothetical protein